MIEVILKREYLTDRVLGTFTVFKDDCEIGRFFSLERPWLDNVRMVSCIPEGDYEVEPNDTRAHPETYRVLDVKGRSGILIHIGNYVHHSAGCILLGLKQTDLDLDGAVEISQSTAALKELNRIIGRNNFRLIVLS